MTTRDDAFSLGVTYWPRRTGPLFWQRYDRGAVCDELVHISDLGFDTVRLCLVWEDFQPGPTRINSRAMRSLEHALDVAHNAGLRVVLALFPVTVFGQLQIPVWANGPDMIGALQRAHRRQSLLIVRPPGLIPVLTGGWYRPVQCGDLFSEPMIVEAQRYLVREVAGYFGDHPAVWVWQVGEGFERVHRPESDQAAARWFETIGEELRQIAPHAACMGVVSPVGLKRRSGPRPEDVAKHCALAGVVVDPPETPVENQTRHTSPAAYLHTLAAGLAERRMIVIGVGMPVITEGETAGWFEDNLFGQAMMLYRGMAGEQAEFINAALERLYHDGAAGVWLPAFADFSADRWQTPPLDRTRRYRTIGVIDAQGREKPAAAAVRDIARRFRDATTQRRQPPAVDAERYWSNPARMFREWWQEFNSRE